MRTIRINSISGWMGRNREKDRAFGRYSYFSDVEQPVTPFPDGSGAVTGSVIGTGAWWG